ncbi:MAG TPA: OmpA family protein, partial [Polyangia bacterium]
DGDAVLDAQDKCPNTAEDLDQYQDEDGCPEEDNDGDGCPDPDNDNDGIPDTYDECPGQAEDADGVDDADGCPDNDNDKDGFLDSADRCPSQAETLNGNKDDDGCPDPGAELVKLTDETIELRERINFGGTPTAPTLTSGAQTLLNLVALVIKGHNDISAVTVAVSAEGAAAASSQARADAIVKYLTGKGVGADRLKAEGGGEGANKVTVTIERRAKNGAPAAPAGP